MGYSLKKKLHAWWEGYDLAPADTGLAAVQDVGESAAQTGDPNGLTLDKLALLQILWGKGFIRPGSREWAASNAKPLLLDDTTTIIEFGAGLGTYARIAGAGAKCYVDGFESDALLVEAAQGLAQSPEEAKFASVALSERGSMPNGKTYHRAVFNRYLHRLEDPLAMLGEMKMQLAAKGALLLNEYTAGAGGLLPDATQAIMDGFGAPRALISRDVYCTALEELGFEVRVSEDASHEHQEMITQGWLRMDKALNDPASGIDFTASGMLISQETARWSALSQALRDNTLEYSRILAIL